MKKLLLMFIVLLAVLFCSCTSFEKSKISGGKVSIEKDGVIYSGEIQKDDCDCDCDEVEK